MALLDTPSLLEGAFLLPTYKTLLLSDTCIMVRRLLAPLIVSGGPWRPAWSPAVSCGICILYGHGSVLHLPVGLRLAKSQTCHVQDHSRRSGLPVEPAVLRGKWQGLIPSAAAATD